MSQTGRTVPDRVLDSEDDGAVRVGQAGPRARGASRAAAGHLVAVPLLLRVPGSDTHSLTHFVQGLFHSFLDVREN